MMTVTPMTDAELARLGTRDDAGFGALECARGQLPLIAMTVEAQVTGLGAAIELEQTFQNTLSEPIEATYIFPLPDRAAVTRFRMEVGGRVIDGVIEERGKARAEYDAAIAAGHRAAITEEDRAGVFTLRVGNLMPGDVATVRLGLIGPLPVDDDEVTFRFPLVVAPRYIPGRALPGPSAGTGVAADTDAVPDASRITPPVLLPGVPNPVRLAIRVSIDPAGMPIGDVRASLHAVTSSQRGGARVVELAPGDRLDRDFILRWTVGDAQIRSSLVVARDEDGKGGTFQLTLVPPRTGEGTGAERPRDVVFVLDRSGSMEGWKMVAARRAVARMVDTLRERDRFAVIAFDNAMETPPGLPGGELAVAGDRNRFRAVEFLAGVGARGGTEMAQPLIRAAGLLAGGYDDRDRILVLATDGQVGNEDQILRQLTPQLRNVRTFALGIDQAVNAAFLRRLAAAGGGSCELIESEDRLDAVMDKVHRRIATPVVTELAVAGDELGIDRGSLAPRRLPDLFAGAPIVIAGRLQRAPGPGAGIDLAGRLPGGGSWRERIAVSAEAPATSVAATWARARIRDLEDQYAAGTGNRDPLEREIVATSLRWRVLSRFTAFLAVDRASKVNPGGKLKPITQAVEMAAGWAGGVPAPAPMAAPTMTGGLTGHVMSAGGGAARGAFTGQSMRPARAPSPSVEAGGARVNAPVAAGPAGSWHGNAPPAPPPPPSPSPSPRGPAAPIAIDVTPYAERAQQIAEAIEAALATTGVTMVGPHLLQRLIELIEDMRSIGGLDVLADQLDDLVARLRPAIRAADETAVAALAVELRAVVTGYGTPPQLDPRRPFWK